MKCPFTQAEFDKAAAEWGCNCGPSALAFACQTTLERARDAIPGFVEKRYTSPTMMKAGLEALGQVWFHSPVPDRNGEHWSDIWRDGRVCLVRVQWDGPWCAPGANPRWAYGHTHWVCTWVHDTLGPHVFDCNGGMRDIDSWREAIALLLWSSNKRATGWFPTHIWALNGGVTR